MIQHMTIRAVVWFGLFLYFHEIDLSASNICNEMSKECLTGGLRVVTSMYMFIDALHSQFYFRLVGCQGEDVGYLTGNEAT
jgi:hypothetical protein